MKLNTILFVIFAALSDAKGKPSSLYHVSKLEQIVPVSYRTLMLRQQYYRRCFDNNILPNCLTSSQNLPFRLLVTKSDVNQSKMNSKDKLRYQRTYADAYADHSKIKRFSKILALVNNKLTLKLAKPFMQYSVKHYPLMIARTRSEMVDKTTPKEVKTIEKLSKKVNTTENLPDKNDTMEKIPKSKRNDKSWYEKVQTSKTSFEKVETALESLENNSFLAEDIKLDQESIFNESFIYAFDQFERKLYVANFNKFLGLSPTANDDDSGMSFVQSGLFLGLSLLALSTEVDLDTKNEIDQNLEVNVPDMDKIELIKRVMSSLPNSSEELKYYRSSRLVLSPGRQLTQQFSSVTAESLQLKIDHFENTQTPEAMAQVLNKMIEKDSAGAIRDTFDEEDLSTNEKAVLITTLYFRARWRSAPTLLNGTWVFRDTSNTPSKTVRMIRLNDIMKYGDFPEWDAEAVEIPYLTQGLSLLIIVPRGISLRRLVEKVSSTNLTSVTKRMQTIRIAVSLPLYTLRMTLLLPSKLQAMGISRIVDASEAQNGSLRISQAVQRIMFWAEAGRNAYKDDGLEWDAPPEMKMKIDRPYIFFVRWRNVSLMNGNFVL